MPNRQTGLCWPGVAAGVSDTCVSGICVSQYTGCSLLPRNAWLGKARFLLLLEPAPESGHLHQGSFCPLPSVKAKSVAQEMKMTTASCIYVQPVEKAKRWRLGFLRWRNFLQTDSWGRPDNGNFRRQSGPTYPPDNHARWIWGDDDYATHRCKNISKVSLSLFFKPRGFIRPNDSKVHSSVYLTGSFGVHDVLSYFPYWIYFLICYLYYQCIKSMLITRSYYVS